MFSTPAFAQEAGESAQDQADQDGFGTIIVTARKIGEDLQRTPIAVTALDSRAIADLQIVTATDVQRAAPGLIARGAGTGPTAIVTFALRGNAQNSPNSVSDPAVGVYLDGVYLARPISSNLGFLDVESIEVLRGTQGTLFGRNTTGGAVSFNTVQPDGEFSGYLKGELGNFEHRLIEGAMTLPISGDELSVRLAGRYTERDGYSRNFFTDAPLGDIDSDVSLRATARFAPASLPITLTVSGEYLDSNDNGTPHVLGAFNPTGPLATLFPGQFSPDFVQTKDNFRTNFGGTVTAKDNVNSPRNFNEAFGFTGTLEIDLDSFTIKSITAYRDTDSGNTLDLDGTPAGGIEFDSHYLQNQFSQELQILGTTGNLDWVIGGLYFTESGNETTESFALHDVPALGGLNLAPSNRNNTDFDSESKALFAQANYSLTDDLRVTAGFRYTWDERSIDQHGVSNIRSGPESVFVSGVGVVVIQPETCRVGPNAGTTPPTACTAPDKAKFNYPSWTLGLDYQINPDVMVYAKTGGASLSGGFNTRAVPLGLESFAEEDVRDVEVGLKSEFLNNKLQANIAGFYVWRDDVQNIVNGIVNGNLSQFVQNSGNVRTKGIEFEGRALPWRGMEFRGAVSRLWSNYADGSFIDIGTNGTFDRSEEEVAQTPNWTINVGATQSVDAGWGSISFHLDYNYTSSLNFGQETADLTNPALTPAQVAQRLSDVDISNELGTLPSYDTVNGRVTIEFDNPAIELAFWGRNILGEQYNENLFNSFRQLGFVAYNPAPPATYGGTVTFRW